MEATANINKLTSNRIEFGETFVVLVRSEDDQKRFTVHHDILTRRSDFFKAARSARWATDPSKPVSLEDDEPDVFSTYLHCVYFDEVIIPRTSVPISLMFRQLEEARQGEADQKFEALVSTYVLADKLRDPITANMVSDKILEVSHDTSKVPSAKAVTIAYQSTTNRDPLRILLRDMCMYHGRTLPTGGDVSWPVEFLQDVVNKLMGNGNLSFEGHAFTRDEARAGRYHQTTSMAARGREYHIDLDAVSDFTPRHGAFQEIGALSPARSIVHTLDEHPFARNSLTESEFGDWLEMAGQDDTFA